MRVPTMLRGMTATPTSPNALTPDELKADLTLDQLKTLHVRSQITRHDCVEGWSAIGKWTGAVLGPILDAAGLRGEARYIVFHCMDRFGPRRASTRQSISDSSCASSTTMWP